MIRYIAPTANTIAYNNITNNQVGIHYSLNAIDDGLVIGNIIENCHLCMIVQTSHLGLQLVMNHFENNSYGGMPAGSFCNNQTSATGILVCGGASNNIYLSGDNIQGFGTSQDIWMDSSTTSADNVYIQNVNMDATPGGIKFAGSGIVHFPTGAFFAGAYEAAWTQKGVVKLTAGQASVSLPPPKFVNTMNCQISQFGGTASGYTYSWSNIGLTTLLIHSSNDTDTSNIMWSCAGY